MLTACGSNSGSGTANTEALIQEQQSPRLLAIPQQSAIQRGAESTAAGDDAAASARQGTLFIGPCGQVLNLRLL